MPPSSDKSPDSASAVFEAIHSIMHQYRAHQYRALRDGPDGLTHLEGKVLGYFARHPGATQSDLVAHSGRDKAQLARLVRTLREQGLLEATADDADRRSTRLHVTEQGKAIAHSVQKSGEQLAQVAAAGLDEGERRQLLALLEKVRATLDAQGAQIAQGGEG
ncbi:MarR family winged helix-turn-helix transcriptional regulator [Pseudoduganella sp. SL102]|uniref:MarR family winged helix-turn-helix transcriptional regulator n=1 Tax=Pseudoduganella sp. SL102 TaxID=2995154 RepID=UPI00248BD3C8|nr:MarR family winged helix-turn-helix transcriptional regulator [Pseudoduganella sp. SL102]WBS03580.1 MarR family winged helix-turn-helix transcriptional regulator [Pseudoduganella sp. SL102]